MVKKRVFFLLSLSFLLGLFLLVRLSKARQEDLQYYEELLSSSQSEEEKSKKSFKTSQIRKGGEKNIWFFENALPRQLQLRNRKASLKFEKNILHASLVESMEEVEIFIQEKLYYLDKQAMQRLRYVKGATADYHYKDSKLIVNDVSIKLLDLAGHKLPKLIEEKDKALMTGTAKTATFSLKDHKIHFSADRLKLRFNG